MRITSSEFSAIGVGFYGEGWESEMARRLGVNPYIIHQYADGYLPVPDTILEDLGIIEAGRRSRIPHAPEWIFGEGEDLQDEYLVHTTYPRFIARLTTDDELCSGVAYITADGEQIADFVWIDVEPDEEGFRDIMYQADDALERHDDYCHRELCEMDESDNYY